MKATLRQKWARARIGLLLVALAGGFGLLGWLAMRDEASPPVPRPSPLAPPPPSRSLREVLADRDIIPSHHHPLLGRPAPDFALADPAGKTWNLTDLREGRPMVLIFYYGYDCIHCARQFAEINRALPLFHEVGTRIAAISADAPEWTRRQFEQDGPFSFPVLADPGNKAAESYGVFMRARDAKMTDIRRHGTFIIDRDGAVRWVNVGDAPLNRTSALLYELAKMGGTLP